MRPHDDMTNDKQREFDSLPLSHPIFSTLFGAAQDSCEDPRHASETAPAGPLPGQDQE